MGTVGGTSFYCEAYMIRRLYRWFMARFRLNLRIVCEESAGKGWYDDYHDYKDDVGSQPYHFVTLRCKRCGKEFII